jgi:uncharacterized protein DUF397
MTKPPEEPHWRRSKRCIGGTCVEVAKVGDQILIRDSKDLDRTPLEFDEAEWQAFVAGVKAGDFSF